MAVKKKQLCRFALEKSAIASELDRLTHSYHEIKKAGTDLAILEPRLEECYQRAISIMSVNNSSSTTCLQLYLSVCFVYGALLQHDLKRYQDAIDLYGDVIDMGRKLNIEQKLEVNETFSDIMTNFTQAVQLQLKKTHEMNPAGQNIDEAISQTRNLIQINRLEPSNYHNLAFLLYRRYLTLSSNADIKESKKLYLKAYSLGFIESLLNLSNVHRDCDDYELAIAYCSKIIHTKKEVAADLVVKCKVEIATMLTKLLIDESKYNRIKQKYKLSDPDVYFEECLETRISEPSLFGIIMTNYGYFITFKEGDAYKANLLYQQYIYRNDNKEMVSNYLLNCLYYTDDLYEIVSIHRQLVANYLLLNNIRPIMPKCSTMIKNSNPIKRVGFVSGDLYLHACSFFLDALFRYHDKTKYAIYLYSTSPTWPLTQLEPFVTKITKIYNLHAEVVINFIQGDNLDILIDCSGHTSKNVVLEVIGRKPVDKIASFLGYPSITGVSTIDYRITQLECDMPMTAMHSERLVSFSSSSFFLNYTPSDQCIYHQERPPIAYAGHTVGSKFRIGIVNKQQKWNHIFYRKFLKNLIDSLVAVSCNFVVVLRSRNPNVAINAFDAKYHPFIEIRRPYDTYYEHLNAYNHLDLALDTFPYNATTIMFEAMLMGIPMYTLGNGKCHHSKIAASIIKHHWPLYAEDLVKSSAQELIEHITGKLDDNKFNDCQKAREARSKTFLSNIDDPAKYSAEFFALVNHML